MRGVEIRIRDEALHEHNRFDRRGGGDVQVRQRTEVAERAAMSRGVVRLGVGKGCRLRVGHEAQQEHNNQSPPVVAKSSRHVRNHTTVVDKANCVPDGIEVKRVLLGSWAARISIQGRIWGDAGTGAAPSGSGGSFPAGRFWFCGASGGAAAGAVGAGVGTNRVEAAAG